eukprot:scaffold7339_cov249-Pinguiococcus_pyrenoidosus.AAC.1
MPMRPSLRISIAILYPWPTSPRIFSFGTTTSFRMMGHVEEARMPSFSSFGPICMRTHKSEEHVSKRQEQAGNQNFSFASWSRSRWPRKPQYLKAGRVSGHHEACDPFVAFAWIHVREDQEDPCLLAVADPSFLAVERVVRAIAAEISTRPQSESIRARPRLRQAETPHGIRRQARQPRLLQCGRAPEGEAVAHQRVLDIQQDRDGRIHPRHFLDGHTSGREAHLRAAEGLRSLDGHEPRVKERLDQLRRHPLLIIHLTHSRCDLFLRKAPHSLLQHALILAQESAAAAAPGALPFRFRRQTAQ